MAESTSKFRNSHGRYLLADLFLEHNRSEADPIYTLKPFDVTVKGITYPSLKQLYLAMEDLTEYDFAVKYLEGYEHWEAMAHSSFLKEHIEQWRKELILKLKSRALQGIIRDAVKDNKYEANKFLVTNGWIDRTEDKKGRGRPSKQEVKEELLKQAEHEKDLQDDLDRLKGLN